jgi:hypothetical protein
MKRILGLGLAALLASQILAACSFGEDLPTYPLPTAAISWDPGTQTTPRTAPCPVTELPSVVIEWDAVHRSLSLGGLKVDLPFGFTGRILPSGRYQIVAPGNTVVAQDGDTIKLGGADTEHVCRVQGVEY